MKIKPYYGHSSQVFSPQSLTLKLEFLEETVRLQIYFLILSLDFIGMDSIKKKMEKLSNETREAEHRIAHYEGIKAANEAEAEKFEEQLRGVQKKIQALESQYDVCTEV